MFLQVVWQNVNNIFVLGENDGQTIGEVGGGVPTSSPETTFLINQKGIGNILQVQREGMDKFVVDNGGNVKLFGSATSTTPILSVITASATVFSITPAGDLYVKGQITVGKDTAGTALIKAGDNKTTITFEIPYFAVPKIVFLQSFLFDAQFRRQWLFPRPGRN